MMADETLLEKVCDLSDLELAVLLCLTAREHCLISTPPDTLDDLVQELQLVANKTFGLRCVVINCDASTTLDSFSSCLLLPHTPTPRSSVTAHSNIWAESYFSGSSRYPGYQPPASSASSLQIAEVVIAKNLDQAPEIVQIQALELLRTRRILTRTAAYSAPKKFLFAPVLSAESGGQAHVSCHLNDHFLLSHWHDPEDGLVNLDDEYGVPDDDASSVESVVKKSPAIEVTDPHLSETDIDRLRSLQQEVQVGIEIVRYQKNIVSFLRMNRAVLEGITPAATRHLDKLARCLAPLHRVDFVTPALVGLAARKVYQHRIRITPPEKERSMQWGSKLDAVEALLVDVTPEEVIDDVLGMVPAPL